MNTANTILQQLGGNKFLVMTGARNLVGSDDALMMRLPGNGKLNGKTVNFVQIALDPSSDTYTMSFYFTRSSKMNLLNQVDGVYFDQLQERFTENTGLDTHL